MLSEGRNAVVQRELTESRCVAGQMVAVHKLLRSLGLENRATMERRTMLSGGNQSSNVH